MVALIVLLLFVGLCIWGFFSDRRQFRREEAECKQRRQAFLADQSKIPKSRVVVTTKGGKVFKSGLFEPTAEIHYVFHHSVDYVTSSNWAQIEIEVTFRRGYYYDYINLQYIPVCEIEEMKVVQEKDRPILSPV
jgi:hypothetical protein